MEEKGSPHPSFVFHYQNEPELMINAKHWQFKEEKKSFKRYTLLSFKVSVSKASSYIGISFVLQNNRRTQE